MKVATVLRDERGSSLVEYSIVFLLLMTMILGIIDFSRAIYAYHFISSQAREATRYASVRGATCGSPPLGDNSCVASNSASGINGAATPDDIRTFVKNVPNGIDVNKLTPDPVVDWPIQAAGPAACTATFNAPGCTVRVQVSYAFNFSAPFVLNTTLNLSATSEAVITH